MAKYWFEYCACSRKIQTLIEKWKTKMNEEIQTASELVKDPSSYSLLTYGWYLLLSVLGGIVRVAREVRFGEKSTWEIVRIFLVEMLTSIFVGLLTFFLCEAAGIRPLYTAVLTSTAGWMGVRALAVIEAFYKSKTGAPLP